MFASFARCRRGVVVKSVPWGLAQGASSGVGGAVLWELLVGVSRVWRCAVGIGDQGVVWVAPCLWDCWAASCGWRCVIGIVSSGWRRVIGIADQGVVWVAPCLAIAGQGVVWVAPCLWDCWAGRRVDGSVSLG